MASTNSACFQFFLDEQMLRILLLLRLFSMRPRVTLCWYIGNSKAKKLLQAYLEQQKLFFHCPHDASTCHWRCLSSYSPPLTWITIWSKETFFFLLCKNTCMHLFQIRDFVIHARLDRFKRNEKRVKIYFVQVH